MAIKSYTQNNKKYYEVFVKVRKKDGTQAARRKRGIASEGKAKRAEYELRKQLESEFEERKWTWAEWHQECLRSMQLSLKGKTVNNYSEGVRKLIPVEWNIRDLKSFTKRDVYEAIFEKISSSASIHLKHELLRRLCRLFEMSVEEGRGECKGSDLEALICSAQSTKC